MSDELTFGSLFAGVGGLDLGLERAGWTVRWQVERDEWCRRVLAKHWPDVPRYGDVRDVHDQRRTRCPNCVEPVDLIAGGFPCQPVSVAGRRRGAADERWLWPEFARLVRLLRPRYVLVENVPGLLAGDGMAEVLGDLAALGFDAEWECIPAAAVGAPHRRWRVFVVAYAGGIGRGEGPRVDGWLGPQRCSQEEPVAHAGRDRLEGIFSARPEARTTLGGGGWWSPEPDVGGTPDGLSAGLDGAAAWERGVPRVSRGVPQRVNRLRGLGNAVVPQVAEVVGRMIAEHVRRTLLEVADVS